MKEVLRWCVGVGFWTVVVSVLWVLVLRVFPPPVTWIMAQQSNEEGAVQREWAGLSGMPRAMPMAVIAAEDQKFYEHFGFDWKAMREAMAYNDRKKGRRVKGASTISQQAAKNVFCWPGRTFVRKGVEAWFTLLIEALWSKERIVEVYLNVAETGKGRFGVAVTARQCFHRAAGALTSAQCALIAAVLPLPRKFNACAPSGHVQRRQHWILSQMNNLGDLFDPQVRERMRDEMERKQAREAKRRKRKR
jgi:monofunctional biosynthetic peptidoglycan transglycosylase